MIALSSDDEFPKRHGAAVCHVFERKKITKSRLLTSCTSVSKSCPYPDFVLPALMAKNNVCWAYLL